jgi:hypothetical protein
LRATTEKWLQADEKDQNTLLYPPRQPLSICTFKYRKWEKRMKRRPAIEEHMLKSIQIKDQKTGSLCRKHGI